MNRIVEWQELESDPGLFTLLVEEFGVQGVQVEEIYDLQKQIEGPVYGFIFLFKWIEERRSRRKITQEEESFVSDENVVNSMFFAQQVIPNSCATHALVSVLLNCDHQIKLGDTLAKIKDFTKNMGPEDKGSAIGNMPELARAHNYHARPEPYRLPEKQQGISTVTTKEAFHFVSYVPVNGRLFELDGLKPYPIDHGPWGEQEDWTEKFRRVISERLGMATGGVPYHDIRFNLMAVVPDRRQQYEQKLKTLKTNRQIVLEALQQMVKVTGHEECPPVKSEETKKGESVLTRSSAKSIAIQQNTNQVGESSPHQTPQPLRSARLKQKAAARAEALAAVSNVPFNEVGLNSGITYCDTHHNYAKSPVTVLHNDDDDDDEKSSIVGKVEVSSVDERKEEESSEEKMDIDFNTHRLQSVKDSDVNIQISVSDDKEGLLTMPTTVASTDVTKPLIIQTNFKNPLPPGTHSGGSSTDTASEVGSLLNSPVWSTSASGQCSPNVLSPNKSKAILEHAKNTIRGTELADRLAIHVDDFAVKSETDTKQTIVCGIKNESIQSESILGGTKELMEDGQIMIRGEMVSPAKDAKSKFGAHQGFTPKDLLALLKNVENEIGMCEGNLRDEIEKRRKYKVDDCRRRHNYDQFICTFLSMLAEQGQLGDLVDKHSLIKRRQGANTGRLTKNRKPDRRRKSQPKKKKIALRLEYY